MHITYTHQDKLQYVLDDKEKFISLCADSKNIRPHNTMPTFSPRPQP